MKEKKIRKSRDRIVCGVAGGIAEYLGIDPLFVRIGFVLLTLNWGSGVLVYFIAALLMDEAEDLTH